MQLYTYLKLKGCFNYVVKLYLMWESCHKVLRVTLQPTSSTYS